jgi:DNA repair exonuclease SbcCD ATPase subunit
MFCQRFVAFPELKAPQRAAVLSEISGANKYLVAAKLAAERATGLSMAISDTEHSKESVEKVIKSLKLNDFDKSSQEWEDGNRESIEDLSAELIVHEEKLKEYKTKYARRVKAEKLLIMAMQTKYDDALTWTEPLPELTKKSARQQADAIKTDAQINSLKSRIKDKQREATRMQETKAGDCPYCGQLITKESLESHLQELNLDIDYMNRELETLQAIYKDEWNAFSKTNGEIAKISNLKRELRELNMDIALKKKDLEALEARKDEVAIQEKIDSIKTQITVLHKAKNPFTGMKEKQEQSLKEEEVRLKEIEAELSRQLEDRQYFTVWAENFPKLRMMLLDDIVTRLETDAQTWLGKYCSELSVEIDTERQTQSGNVRDEVNITIVTPKGKVPYEGYGGGEIQKIRMAISLALSEIIAEKAEREYNVIIFDEPNVGLDRVGKESNIEVFKDLAESKTVLIIEHDEYFQDRMDETITVVKENHKSFIQGV